MSLTQGGSREGIPRPLFAFTGPLPSACVPLAEPKEEPVRKGSGKCSSLATALQGAERRGEQDQGGEQREDSLHGLYFLYVSSEGPRSYLKLTGIKGTARGEQKMVTALGKAYESHVFSTIFKGTY